MEVFKQYATGNFTVEVAGEWHCGPNHDSPKSFNYEVELEYAPHPLDPHGFLYDNTLFQGKFDSLGTVDISCERLVQELGVEFLYGHPRAKAVSVKIWAIPNRVCVCFTKRKSRWAAIKFLSF